MNILYKGTTSTAAELNGGKVIPIWNTIENEIIVSGINTNLSIECWQNNVNIHTSAIQTIGASAKIDLSIFYAFFDEIRPIDNYSEQKILIKDAATTVTAYVLCVNAPNVGAIYSDMAVKPFYPNCVEMILGKSGSQVQYLQGWIGGETKQYTCGQSEVIQLDYPGEIKDTTFIVFGKELQRVDYVKGENKGLFIKWLNSAGGYDWQFFDSWKMQQQFERNEEGAKIDKTVIEIEAVLDGSNDDAYNWLCQSSYIEAEIDGVVVKLKCSNKGGAIYTNNCGTKKLVISLYHE